MLATLGYLMFHAVAKPNSKPAEEEIFHCRSSGAEGKGIHTTSDGIVILKGSTGPGLSGKHGMLRLWMR